MGRRPQPEIRAGLLEACTDHALMHGLPDRLAPLAAAAGTSARMLIYHFETRDGLRREILTRARERQVAAFTDVLEPRPDEAYAVTLLRAWTTISGPTGQRYFRLFHPISSEAAGLLKPGFRREATTDWLAPLGRGTASLGCPDLATVVLAVIRGLLMDLEATGDAARVDQALADFVATLPVQESLG